MRIEPDQTQRLAAFGEPIGGTGHRADRDAVIAAEHERHAPVIEAAVHCFHEILAGGEDRLLVAQPSGADLLGLGDHHIEIAVVLDLVSQVLELLLQIRDADRGGAHVHASTARAEVDGDTDHTDIARLLGH